MNFKRWYFVVISILIGILFMMIPNKSNATDLSTPVYFGISLIRENSATNVVGGNDAGKNIGYALGNPEGNTTSDNLRYGANIWNLLKYPSNNTSIAGTKGNFYCAREGAGFPGATNTSTTIREYSSSFDMTKDNKTTIKNNVAYLKNIADIDYNAIIALSNYLYLGETDAERIAYLNSVGIFEEDYSVLLSEEDIKAVQQVALWYYTNKHDQTIANQWSTLYDKTSTDNLLFYTVDGSNYSVLSMYDFGFTSVGKQTGSGKHRLEQANILYRYLITKANQDATSESLEQKVKITLYTNLTAQNETQPVLSFEKAPEEIKDFDLALRKYITKVDGEELTGANSRIPNIDRSTLTSGTTATYKHRKDAITVKTGSVVTYKLTIYNEGDKAGRATKIIDQLPTGLKYSKINTSGFSATYDTSLNKVTITRDSGNTNNLLAYDGNILSSETIEIECIVTAVASASSDNILTNVAWIAEEHDAVDNITITTQNGKDRDSEPFTSPNVNKDNMSSYTGNENKTDLIDSNYYYKGYQDDDDFEKLKLPKANEGEYNVVLVKEDANGEQLNSTATFEVNGETKTVTGKLSIASNVKITESNVSTVDVYTIKELVPPDEYCKFDGTIQVNVSKVKENNIYKVKNVDHKVYDSEGNDITSKTEGVDVYLNTDGNIYVEVKNYQFDLKLVKRIVEVNGQKVPERIEDVDITALANGTSTTANYTLNKQPVVVKKGDIVKYTLRIYNEGQVDGYASEISEDIPEGLELVWSEKTGDELKNDTTLTDLEKEAINYNQIIWDFKTVNNSNNKIEMITTNYLAKGKGAELANNDANLIKSFNPSKGYINNINDKNPDYKEISVYMRVVSENSTKSIIRNEAAITEDTDKNGNQVDDRDSDTKKWVKYEDDEDYDNIVLETFDLALRKFIIAVSNDTTIENSEYIKNDDGTYKRAPQVDTSKLNTIGEDGNIITTAIYNHTKEPVEVSKGNYVVYMLRVYNESDISGYASEIKDQLPPYLEYVDCNFNNQYGWEVSTDKRTVTTTYLDKELIEKVEVNDDGTKILSYKEVPIMCKVLDNAKSSEEITNIADITLYKDENKKIVTDRDSKQDNVVLPSDEQLPAYKDDMTGDYIPGQEDDDDFEKVIIKRFDLALRKFITAVNDNAVTTRVPQVDYDATNNKITYNHTKDPVEVVTEDIVTYTIRVYNEGEVDGYASKVSDDLPAGLEYLPENELNKEYRWVMYDKDGKETSDVSKAVKITTDYLSKEQGEKRKESNVDKNPALLTAFDKEQGITSSNPDYADVKVAFKVVEPNTSNKIIVNSAQISDDTDKNGNPIDDNDSTTDEWIDGEDDQDKEYIKLTYFDLALRKWVTQAIVIENGTETVTNTGHKAEDDPEEVVKVELNRKKLNQVTVKFKYSIKITNEGDIAGYAKEITDYVPTGLKFVAADNQGWTDEGNNVISTKLLENTLLKPGESAEVQVTLTWINGNNNLGLKNNIAEISKDYNDKHAKDVDSTPDNKIIGEDDIDDAPVLLSISTGKATTYFTLVLAVLITLASGITIIKKFVL